MPDSVLTIIEKQTELYGSICRAIVNIKKLETKKRTPEQIQTRIDLLEANWKKFQGRHDQLTSMKAEERAELPYFSEDFYEKCEEAYVDSKAEMLAYLNALRTKAGQSSSSASDASCAKTAPSSRQLPRINLPRFSGSYREWRQFRDLFTSMIINNQEISNVEKMQYLKMNLTGEPAQLVINIDVTSDNFTRAWGVIVDRYENKRVLIDTHLSSLFSIQKVNQQSTTELKQLLGTVKEALGALNALGCPTDSWDCVIVYMVTRKLDSDTLIDWEKQIGTASEPATFTELEKFLLGRIYALEAVARAADTRKPRPIASTTTKDHAKSHQATAIQKSDNSAPSATNSSLLNCALCSAGHYVSTCPDYNNKTVEQRRDFLKQKNLCFNCLGPHLFRNCRTAKRCRICGNPHHTTIHRSTNLSSSQPQQSVPVSSGSQSNVPVISKQDSAQPGTSASINNAFTTSMKHTPVLLATAIVKVTSCYGEQFEARALLDQGSEVSFMTKSLAQRINLPRQRVSLPIYGIGGQPSTVSHELMNFAIVSRVNPVFSISINAYVLAKLTSYLPPIQVIKTPWQYLQDLELADPEFSSATQIDLILGAEVYSQILEQGLRKGDPGSPIAQQTALGWILSGSTSFETDSTLSSRPTQGLQCSVDHELLDLVQRFWDQEEVSSASHDNLSTEEAQCEQHFSETHSRTSEGRYVVRIPFKRLPDDFGNSYKPALYALSRQEKRFETNPSLKTAYSKFMTEYEALGHMTIAPDSPTLPQRVFYLPHHAVVRETSSTTKVRVVFNGSYRTNLGISVNDFQHIGPKLQSDLADVITRWRRYAYVFSADVEKMYRQIRVHPKDWDFQRILWRHNSESPPLSYHLCTVTYGLASAPYLAIRTLQQLAIDEEERFPLATDIIQREIYVDDVLSGADSIPEAQEKIRQINECLKAGCFTLQKWTSNDEELLTNVSLEKQAKTSSVSLKSDLVRALGILWQPRSDSFVFTSHSKEEAYRVSKRTVLSRVAQLFDPLGWIAPVVVRGKIFVQELWSAKLNWDEPLSEELTARWRNFEKDLQDISLISVPRWLGTHASPLLIELHGFSDASQVALGTVIYLRVATDFTDIRISLVSAKTRVAPLKRVTIPRLELSAALLLVRQISHMKKTLDLNEAPVHLWTDSTVALAYIRGDVRRWADYVHNRVVKIKELSNSHWHHVPGKENPADYASRGLSPRQLQGAALWWNGPEWLSKHSTSWPSVIPLPDSSTELEMRKTPVIIANKGEPKEIWDLVERFSNLTTLLRITAWCLRAIQRFRRQSAKNQSSPINPEEIDAARLFWVKTTQAVYFRNEINQLSRNENLSRSSALLRLAPFVDASGLLRVGGRLQNSLLDSDEKHPLILPRESALTTLTIDDTHSRTLHGGTQVTLVTLRRRYWIVGGRVPVRAFIHRCIRCVRHRAVLGQQLMGQLPKSRVTGQRPFRHSGVDYAGPLTIRTFRGRGAKTYKGYIVVFVCLSSSAVHLEIATDYSTEGFLAAYKRFTSRRGVCETLTSDCGTNFVGADKELRKLFQTSSKEASAIANILANDGTLWKFNPPSSPHFGGKWEAAVKSVKFHLKRVIGDTGFTFEEFSTLLSQIEAVLNSRPLCPLSDDPTDLTALTPGHFLIGSALNAIPEPSLIDLPSSRLSRWQLLRQMLEQFWKRWSTEYLQHLQTLSKWQHRFHSLKIGSLVLVKDERYPPSKWALGRVIDVHPGQDNLVRVVTVRTQHSVYKRPIVKLVLLPVSTNDDYLERSTHSNNNLPH